MATVRTFAAWITVAAALALLFVVVCPLTPTPLAVVSNHGTQLSNPALAAAPLLGAASGVVVLGALHRRVGGHLSALQHAQSPHPGHGRLSDLTCIWLC